MAPPTKAQIADLTTRYIAYARNDSKIDNKLIRDIVTYYQSFGSGDWEFDMNKPVPACFQGISFICWKFSSVNNSANAVDAAALYRDLTTKNYNVWVTMTDQTKRENFKRDCCAFTDTETYKDYRDITWDKKVQRSDICEAAITVTSAMYGPGAQTEKSEALWNKRNANQNA
ncbi:hypothetical protein AAF712_006587 [Marasmius tenuissimus]|uniref:Uncharacterized protein n=1 Tax=Marasmius tenuissimus TaxID=585030 RepID=A0ABR2ZZ41_9AGAR